jgi:prephenate dehydratase
MKKNIDTPNGQPPMVEAIERLVVLGPAGSYLDGLVKSMDLGYPVEYGDNFANMIALAEELPGTAILLPIKNTMKGTLNDVVGAFQGGKLMVEAVAKLDVVSNIMGIGTIEEATSIGGKDVALEQITRYMPHLDRVIMSSTSAAGKHIRDSGDKTMLSVGALAQAELYGLDVHAKGVQDADGINRTTVLMTRARNGWELVPEEIDPTINVHGTMIMRLNDSNAVGSLYRAMGEIADRGINLTSLESLNIRGSEVSEFFVTFSGIGTAIADIATSKSAAKHLRMDVLGLYDEPILYDS